MSQLDWDGHRFRLFLNDFTRGIWNPYQYGGPTPDGFAFVTSGYRTSNIEGQTYVPGLEPIESDGVYNATAFGSSGPCFFMFPYFDPTSITAQMIAGRNGNTLYEVPTTGASTGLTPTLLTTVTRNGAQALAYLWIADGQAGGQMYRYNKSNPGSSGKVSLAGTKAPTNAPTTALATGSELTIGAGYGYRYAWEYGTNRELGMGWKQTASLVTPTSGNQNITITMDASPPTSYTHVVSRALFRNTPNYSQSYFLVTRTAYSGSALSTTYRDSTTDAAIEGGEETDPVYAETTTAPIYSELIPPSPAFIAVHEGRLWGLGVSKNSTNYPHTAIYSRVSPVGPSPRFDQFELTATIQVAPPEIGKPTGLLSWFGSLWAFFDNGIARLTQDPGPGKLPAFSVIVMGRGCIAPRTLTQTPYGVTFMSNEGLVLFDGTPNLRSLSNRVRGMLTPMSSVTLTAGFDSIHQEIVVFNNGTELLHNVPNDQWWAIDTATSTTISMSTAACSLGGKLHSSANDGFIYIRGTNDLGQAVEASRYTDSGQTTTTCYFRQVVAAQRDLGYPELTKAIHRIGVSWDGPFAADASMTLAARFHYPGGIETVTKNFPAATSRYFTFSFGPESGSTAKSQCLAFSVILSIPTTVTGLTPRSLMFTGFEVEGIMDKDREYVRTDG